MTYNSLYDCEKCGILFECESTLKEHKTICTGPRTYWCMYCDKNYNDEKRKITHQATVCNCNIA